MSESAKHNAVRATADECLARVTITMPATTRARLERLAAVERRSLSAQAELLLARGLDAAEAARPAALA